MTPKQSQENISRPKSGESQPNSISLARRPELYQNWLKKKYGDFDDAYWLEIDELGEKLKDLNKSLPELRIPEFAFITDWNNGKIASRHVDMIFKTMNLPEVAHTRVTRRLTNYMFANEETADMVKHVLAGLKDKALPMYLAYLNMLAKFFEILSRIDDEQIPITWLEQELPNHATGQIKTHICDMPLNQFIRQMDTYILPSVEKKHFIDDNIIVFDEFGDVSRMIHWIFAPKSYIDLLKELYSVKEKRMLEQDKTYITKLIQDYK